MPEKKNSGRRAPRSPVTPFEIKGEIIRGSDASGEAILIWNISDSGLCLWATEKYAPATEVTLKISHPWAYSLRSVIRWVRPVRDRTGFLLGIEVVDDKQALAEIHASIKGVERAV
jgi:hypothetical protein